MTRSDLVERSHALPEETGKCRPYNMSGITSESCRLRKEYAIESEDPDVKKCVTCTGLKWLRKTKKEKIMKRIVLIALMFAVTACGEGRSPASPTIIPEHTGGDSISIEKVDVSVSRDGSNLLQVSASGWVTYRGTQKVNEVEYGLLVNKCGTSGDKVWVDIKYAQVVDGLLTQLNGATYTFPECPSMSPGSIFEVEFRVLMLNASSGPTVARYLAVPKDN